MTKVSLEADIRMEERRKKSRGENLEDRQMKRYMRSLKRKARKESQSQVRTPESISTFTDALESKKIDVKKEKKTEIKSENITRDIRSKDETGQESKKKASQENKSTKKEKDTKRTSEWVEEMNKINDQKSQEKKKDRKKQKQKQSSSTTNENETSSSPEFSPILYWREPMPDVEILGLEPADNAEIGNITNSSKSPEDELKRCLSLDNKTVWFDKSKCEDAEAKFQAKKAKEANKSSTKQKKEDKKESSPKATDGKQTKTQENTIRELNDYGDKTLEDVLEDFRCDNDRFRTQIIGLSQIIENLQIRIGHLESTPPAEESRKLSESDEGVDMTELAHNKGQIMMNPALTSTSTAHSTVGVSLRNSHQ